MIKVKVATKKELMEQDNTLDFSNPCYCDFCLKLGYTEIFGWEEPWYLPLWFCNETCLNLFLLRGEPV